MSLRDRLIALLRDPAYSPGNEFELARRLNLKKRERASLAHEVRLLLKSGDFARAGNGRIARRGEAAPAKRGGEARKIFVPTRRGPTMPPPEDKEHSPVKAASPRSATHKREPRKHEPQKREPHEREPHKRETHKHEPRKGEPRKRTRNAETVYAPTTRAAGAPPHT